MKRHEYIILICLFSTLGMLIYNYDFLDANLKCYQAFGIIGTKATVDRSGPTTNIINCSGNNQ